MTTFEQKLRFEKAAKKIRTILDVEQSSILYSQILFRRFDQGTIKRRKLNYRVVKFDYIKGRFVDLRWGRGGIVRVLRTKKNKYFVYRKSFIVNVFYLFLTFIYNTFLKK